MPLVRFRRGIGETDAQADVTVVLPDGAELDVPAGATVEDVAFGSAPGSVATRSRGRSTANSSKSTRRSTTAHGSDRHGSVRQVPHGVAPLRRPRVRAGPPAAPSRSDAHDRPPDRRGVLLRRDRRRPRRGRPRRHRGGDGRIIAADYDIEREVRSREEAKEIYADNEYKLQILDGKPTTGRSPSTCRTTGRTSVRAPTSSRRADRGDDPLGGLGGLLAR